MTDTPTRFPLAWPVGRPRCKWPKPGKFGYTSDRGYKEPITVARAMDRLEDEVGKLGGVNTLLSSNINTRLDGRPRSGDSEPVDSGVCLYFTLKGKPMALACDAYTKVAQNIAALAAHLEATRAIERHGVATAAETLQAFQALPPPIVTPPPVDWRKIFGVTSATADEIGALYRVKAKARAGDQDALTELNVARDLALGEITAGGGQARIGVS